jgi:hypothetical protein
MNHRARVMCFCMRACLPLLRRCRWDSLELCANALRGCPSRPGRCDLPRLVERVRCIYREEKRISSSPGREENGKKGPQKSFRRGHVPRFQVPHDETGGRVEMIGGTAINQG